MTIQTSQSPATPLWGFLFYTSFQKANRIETMVDKYTKHSILNAMQESRNIGIGGK
jgi:hypothetical protein